MVAAALGASVNQTQHEESRLPEREAFTRPMEGKQPFVMTTPPFGYGDRAPAAEQAQLETVRARLSPADRANFDAIAERRLNGQSALLDRSRGQTLLEIIADLQNRGTPLLAGIDRQALISDLLRNMATDPPVVRVATQGKRASCTMAVEQFIKCDENPADYARIVRDLATRGESTLLSGDNLPALMSCGRLALDADNRDGGFHARGLSEQLFQNAMMHYAAGNYDPMTDIASGSMAAAGQGNGTFHSRGLFPPQQERAAEAGAGRYFRYMNADLHGRDAACREVLDELGKPGIRNVRVIMEWAQPGDIHALHCVAVRSINGNTVSLMNTQNGTLHTMSLAEFQSKLNAVFVSDPSGRGVTQLPPGFFGGTTSEQVIVNGESLTVYMAQRPPAEDKKPPVEPQKTGATPATEIREQRGTGAAAIREDGLAGAASATRTAWRRRSDDEIL